MGKKRKTTVPTPPQAPVQEIPIPQIDEVPPSSKRRRSKRHKNTTSDTTVAEPSSSQGKRHYCQIDPAQMAELQRSLVADVVAALKRDDNSGQGNHTTQLHIPTSLSNNNATIVSLANNVNHNTTQGVQHSSSQADTNLTTSEHQLNQHIALLDTQASQVQSIIPNTASNTDSNLLTMPIYSVSQPISNAMVNTVPVVTTTNASKQFIPETTSGMMDPMGSNTDKLGINPLGSIAAANQAMDKLAGKTISHTYQATSLNEGLSDAIREDIWSNRFVDFVQLLKVTSPYADPDLKAKDKKEKIHSYIAWAKAFDIYHSVYIQKFPSLGAALLTHGCNVRDLYQRYPMSYSWREYDEKFRYRRQSTLCPWDRLDADLWVKCTTYNLAKSTNFRSPQNLHQPRFPFNPNNNNPNSGSFGFNQNFSRQQNNNNNPRPANDGRNSAVFKFCIDKGICFRFQKGVCSGQCKFRHVCHVCLGEHSPNACPQNRNKYSHSNSS